MQVSSRQQFFLRSDPELRLCLVLSFGRLHCKELSHCSFPSNLLGPEISNEYGDQIIPFHFLLTPMKKSGVQIQPGDFYLFYYPYRRFFPL